MLSKKLLKSLNDQIQYEFFASQQYLAISGFFASQNLKGFSSYFETQMEEEYQHGMKFFEFINDKGGSVSIPAVKEPKNDFASIIEPFEIALKYENEDTQRLYKVMNIAVEQKEHATASFLKAFIDIQVKEVAEYERLVHQLKLVHKDGGGIFMLNQKLGTGAT